MSRAESFAVVAIAGLIITIAMAFYFVRGQTYVHIDAIAHVNKARGLWDSLTPGLYQLGSIWLPLPHLLMAPLTLSDTLWTTGLAGSLLTAICFVGTAWLHFATSLMWAGSRLVAWFALAFFVLHARLIYLFTIPMTEPLMITCTAGLVYFLIRWARTGKLRDLAVTGVFAFAGTWIRYEGWAIAAAMIPIVAFVSRKQRVAATILFAGAVALGPLIWMIYNLAYFDDPLMFTYGRGSAADYAFEHFLRTGKTFPTAGNWTASFRTYVANVAYCVSPSVLWLAIGGLGFALGRRESRSSLILITAAATPFAFYVFNLYANSVPLMMPGLLEDEPQSIYNVRYGTIMAATLPQFAAVMVGQIVMWTSRQRFASLLLLAPFILPNPIPPASRETVSEQFTRNLFYTEATHNQSYWMPAFVDAARKLQAHDDGRLILANTRIVHPVVWATGIPIRRFVHEMNKEKWERNLGKLDADIGWVIVEEGEQLWHAKGKFFERELLEVARAKSPASGVVHLFRRDD